ncbi:hypothetical protein GIB67_025605 [Kingdonia uniflora]|uniref:Glutaredoxin domain-containing protein n=1 Tax=Kingdonia uniflora TaxID=39325 RepID=A0A7J7MGZ5_9MAGN|nr:hypothetical protein GIB67_025605 [Kingdonia uniflora]
MMIMSLAIGGISFAPNKNKTTTSSSSSASQLLLHNSSSNRLRSSSSSVTITTRRIRSSSLRCFSALNPQLKITLDKVTTSNKVVLFMKGTKDFPQCGFSNTIVQILKSLNVLLNLSIYSNELLRQGLKEYSSWPTFPQLYIDGEFLVAATSPLRHIRTGSCRSFWRRQCALNVCELNLDSELYQFLEA